MANKKKNVLLLVGQLYGGGAEKTVSNLSLELSLYYNITIAIFLNTENPTLPYKGDLVKIKLPFSKNTSQNSFLFRLIRFIILINKVRQLKKNKKIDVSISFLEASNIINILTRKKIKTIISVRSHLSSEFEDNARLRLFKYVIMLLYNKATSIITPSLLIKTDLIKNFKVKENKIYTIPNFIDTNYIQERKKGNLRNDLGKIFKYPILINVGRLTNPKGQWYLMPILKEVRKINPQVKLIILGDGPLKNKIISESDNAGMKCYTDTSSFTKYNLQAINDFDIYLPGNVENIYPYLFKSDIFVFPSIYEGFPNVIIEAMASGLPIVSSDCKSGPREILSSSSENLEPLSKADYAEYGILLPSLENTIDISIEQIIKKWAATINELLEHPHLKAHYVSKSLKRASHYKKESIVPKWLSLIDGPTL